MTAFLRVEIVRQFRHRDALAWRLGLPPALYVLFRAVFGADGTSEGLPSDTTATVIFAVFASLAAGLYSTAPSLAQERATGWLRQLRVTPLRPRRRSPARSRRRWRTRCPRSGWSPSPPL
jgi:ABC-2 type transport system permease protein